MVNDFEPTAVANEFAASLEPIPVAAKNEKTPPVITSHKYIINIMYLCVVFNYFLNILYANLLLNWLWLWLRLWPRKPRFFPPFV